MAMCCISIVLQGQDDMLTHKSLQYSQLCRSDLSYRADIILHCYIVAFRFEVAVDPVSDYIAALYLSVHENDEVLLHRIPADDIASSDRVANNILYIFRYLQQFDFIRRCAAGVFDSAVIDDSAYHEIGVSAAAVHRPPYHAVYTLENIVRAIEAASLYLGF